MNKNWFPKYFNRIRRNQMYFILSIGIDIFSTAILFIPCMMLLYHFRKPYSQRMLLFAILFGLYLSAVFSVTGIPSIDSLIFDLNINVVPFICFFNGYPSGLEGLLLNILLFIPLGLLLPLFGGTCNSLRSAAAAGLGLSLFIEIMQIFTFRATDIDDLIANTLGAVIGFVLTKSISKIAEKTASGSERATLRSKQSALDSEQSALGAKQSALGSEQKGTAYHGSNSFPKAPYRQKCVPLLVVLLIFFLMFFIQCWITNWIWEMIL